MLCIAIQVLINQRKNLIDSFFNSVDRRNIEFMLSAHTGILSVNVLIENKAYTLKFDTEAFSSEANPAICLIEVVVFWVPSVFFLVIRRISSMLATTW